MRPLIIYTGIFAEPENNAAGKRVFGNSLIFEALGYDVLMLGKTQAESYKERKQYTEHISFESYPEFGRIRYKGYIEYLKRIIDEQVVKPVCIVRYGAPGLSIFDNEVIKLAHGQGIKVIADVVDWLSADGGNFVFNTIKTVDTYMEKALFNAKSDGVIAISSYLGNYYKKKVKNVVVIPPIVQEYKKNIAKNDVVNIVYAGAPFRMGLKVKDVHKIKDRLDLAVAALAEVYRMGFTKLRFNIYGITKEQYLVAFPDQENIINATGEALVFNGRRPMAEIQAELTRSDFSILLREVTRGTTAGFPTKVVESMSCGTPMITTRTSDLSNYIVDEKNGFFVEIENREKLVEQLTKIISMKPDAVRAIKDNCYMGEQFLPKSFKDQMRVFISEVLE